MLKTLLFLTLTIAAAEQGAIKGKADEDVLEDALAEVDTQDLALFKLVEEIKAMNTTKETAPSLSAYIREMLLPRADDTTAYLQEKIWSAERNIRSCYHMVVGAEADQKAAEEDGQSNEAKNEACEFKDREDMTAEELICADFAAEAMAFQKNAVKLQKVKHNLREFEKALKSYYDFYPEFIRQKNACWEATGEEHSQHAHCLFRRHYIEKAYCALRHNLTALCNEYDRCYKRNVEIAGDMEEKVKALENHTKMVYKGLSCMMRNTGWEFATDVNHFIKDVVDDAHLDCDKAAIDVSHLEITYPSVPGKEPCNKEVAMKAASSIKCAGDEEPEPEEKEEKKEEPKKEEPKKEEPKKEPSAGPGY